MTAIFTRTDDRLGVFALRTVDPDADAPLVHRWLTHPTSVFWLMTESTCAEVAAMLRALDASPDHDAFLGTHDGEPAFLVERYDPHNELGDVYPVEPGDVGMHILVAPTDRPIHGFTRAVFVTVMDLLFSDPRTRRVVVEPDVRNTAVHARNAEVGFRVAGTVRLPRKDAYLSFCTRDDYETARGARP